MPERKRSYHGFHIAARIAFILIVLPCVYFGGASSAYFLTQRTSAAATEPLRLTSAQPPAQKTRLLVFSPHCDDETLGCGGLITRTLEAGGTVRVGVLTNGDGFRTAAEHYRRTMNIGPQDFIQFATLRQEESCRALETLGMNRRSVLFFSYPDRGLMNMWNTNWNPQAPYSSAFTRCSSSPYTITFNPHSSYCGQDLLTDIKTAIKQYRPTLVTITHPSDDHPDHAAASAFVTRAVQELQSDPSEAAWAKNITLRYYIIHRGDWPRPQGYRTHEPLNPPTGMNLLDTKWQTLSLNTTEVSRKAKSIQQYGTQTAVMNHFLVSFLRSNELLGEMHPARLARVPDGAVRVDARLEDWAKLSPTLLDPVRDNVLRDLQGSGDIRSVYVCRDSNNLYLRLDMRQPASRRIAYTVRLRAFSATGTTADEAVTLRLKPMSPGSRAVDGVRTASRGRLLEAAIPWSQVTVNLNGQPVRSIGISVDTSLAGIEIDKSGIRFLSIDERAGEL